MEQMMITIINDFGYIGIAFLIAFENIFPPIPSEVILTFGVFLTSISKMNIRSLISSPLVPQNADELVLVLTSAGTTVLKTLSNFLHLSKI